METGNYKVSVIIPVYNCEKYIARCIKSIKGQTENNFEVLVINDGSTDESEIECLKAIDGDPRFKFHSKENTGVSDTRNMALKLACGENILFIDADDWIPDNYIDELLKAKFYAKADIVCCGYLLASSVGKKIGLKLQERLMSKEEALDGLSPYYYTSVWGKLFDRSVIQGIRFRRDLFYSEDTLFYTQALLRTRTVYWSDKTMYFYFVNSEGAMSSKNPERFYSDFVARAEILNLYENNGLDTKSAKYWLLDSSLNVKKVFYQSGEFRDIRLESVNLAINTYKWVFISNIKQQLRALMLMNYFIFKVFEGIVYIFKEDKECENLWKKKRLE